MVASRRRSGAAAVILTLVEGAFTSGEAGTPARHLRPLGIGEVLHAAVALYRHHAASLWKIVAVVIVPVGVINEIVIGASLPAGAFVRSGTLHTPTGRLATPATGQITEISLSVIAGLIIQGALSLSLVYASVGRPVDWGESIQQAGERLGALLVLSILYAGLVVLGLAALIVPGIWLMVAWSVAVPALMFEHVGGFQALGRSLRLVGGRWWATFAALLVALIMLFVVLLAVGLMFGAIESGLEVDSTGLWLGLGWLARTLADLIAFPFMASVVAVVYIDLRVRKEALDLEALAGALDRPAGTGVR